MMPGTYFQMFMQNNYRDIDIFLYTDEANVKCLKLVNLGDV